MNLGEKISSFSLWFIRRWRITVLLFMSILILGIGSYGSFLKREGFPPIEFPGGTIQVQYFAQDKNLVDKNVTNPIEDVVSDIEGVKEINSTTGEVFSFFFIQFEEGENSEKIMGEIESKISDISLPETAIIKYDTLKASSIDNKHNFIFTLSGDKTPEEFQRIAQKVAEKLTNLDLVEKASVINLISEQENPTTGEKVDYQSRFSRVGFLNDGEFIFENSISIGIIQKEDAGTLDLSKSIRATVDDMRENGELEGLNVEYGGDLANALNRQFDSLQSNAISGILAVILVLFFFIGVRAAVVTAIFIPTVMSATFLGLYLTGYSLNVLTLFALVLVLGLFVDDGIVVVEAIDYERKKGVKTLDAVKNAVSSIGVGDISGTLTTVLVFLPMAFISGVLGDFIIYIPITVIISLIFSVTIALTIIPFLTNISHKFTNQSSGIIPKIPGFIGRLTTKVSEKAEKFVNLYLRKWYLGLAVFIVSILIVGFGMSFGGKLKFSIFPTPDDTDEISLSISFPPNLDGIQQSETVQDIEQILVDIAGDELESANYYYTDDSGTTSYMAIGLSKMSEREVTSKEIVDELNKEFEKFMPARVKAGQASVGPPPDEFPLGMRIFSEDQEELLSGIESIAPYLKSLELDDEKIEKTTEVGLDSILKIDGKRYTEIKIKYTGEVSTGQTEAFKEKIEKHFDKEELEKIGFAENEIEYNLGQEEQNMESFTSAGIALVIALGLMYILLAIQFRSVLQPLLIFVAIPFSFPGVFPGLYITDNAMSFFVMIGLIGLIGIVVNNTIMIVEFINQRRKNGIDPKIAVAESIKIRTRAILTTTTTTVAGLLPLALTDPFWESLALTIVFGLISSSILVLTTFPIYYQIIEIGIPKLTKKILRKSSK